MTQNEIRLLGCVRPALLLNRADARASAEGGLAVGYQQISRAMLRFRSPNQCRHLCCQTFPSTGLAADELMRCAPECWQDHGQLIAKAQDCIVRCCKTLLNGKEGYYDLDLVDSGFKGQGISRGAAHKRRIEKLGKKKHEKLREGVTLSHTLPLAVADSWSPMRYRFEIYHAFEGGLIRLLYGSDENCWPLWVESASVMRYCTFACCLIAGFAARQEVWRPCCYSEPFRAALGLWICRSVPTRTWRRCEL